MIKNLAEAKAQAAAMRSLLNDVESNIRMAEACAEGRDPIESDEARIRRETYALMASHVNAGIPLIVVRQWMINEITKAWRD